MTPTTVGIRSNISPKLLELKTSNLVGRFVLGMPSRRTNNLPESRRGLGHVTPTIFGIRSNISLKLLEFPKSGRCLGHVTRTIFGSTVGYPSDSLVSCLYSAVETISLT